LIDGYNLLHASGVFGTGGRTSLESSREALLDWLAHTLSDVQRSRTTIVFDAQGAPPGLPDRSQRHGIQIRFAPRGQEADDLLERLIREHSAPRGLLVVSSDHRLHRAARRRRARAVDSDVWVARARRCARPARAAPDAAEEIADRIPEEEVQAWLDEFLQE
jgi:predicted RNA-binding protein with PIN domain